MGVGSYFASECKKHYLLNSRCYHSLQEYPMSLDSNDHETLLHRKSISFKPTPENDDQGAEWSRVTLENGVKIVGKKEVSTGPNITQTPQFTLPRP